MLVMVVKGEPRLKHTGLSRQGLSLARTLFVREIPAKTLKGSCYNPLSRSRCCFCRTL